MESKQIISIPAEDLLAHPKNPNIMSKTSFEKLKANIKRSGNYEPVIVRTHPSKAGKYQIISGHHRCKALAQLGYKQIDSVVWNLNDSGALILLESLNRLRGKDDIEKKSQLIKTLAESYKPQELSTMLACTKKDIESLLGHTRINENPLAKAYLQSLVFFVSNAELETINYAIEIASKDITEDVKYNRTSKALLAVCRQYLRSRNTCCPDSNKTSSQQSISLTQTT